LRAVEFHPLVAARQSLFQAAVMRNPFAGAQVALWPTARISESDVIARAASSGVAVYGISPYFLSTPPRRGFMLGYSRMKENDIREGVRRLSQVL
jgi:GntR family transcriptional regulator / MocR family aminotransferase